MPRLGIYQKYETISSASKWDGSVTNSAWFLLHPGTPLTGSSGYRITVTHTTMLHSYTCDTTPVKSSVVQRGQQTDCTESSCRVNSKNATAWNRQQSIARAAGNAAAKHSATQFRSRGRDGSL